MRELVTSLRQLQQMEITLQESRIVHGDRVTVQIERLQNEIRALRESLPELELRRFDGLKRNGIPVVVEVREGVCTGCHLNVPRGDLNRMAREDSEWLCPNCGRYLLLFLRD